MTDLSAEALQAAHDAINREFDRLEKAVARQQATGFPYEIAIDDAATACALYDALSGLNIWHRGVLDIQDNLRAFLNARDLLRMV